MKTAQEIRKMTDEELELIYGAAKRVHTFVNTDEIDSLNDWLDDICNFGQSLRKVFEPKRLTDRLNKWFDENFYGKETVNGHKVELDIPFGGCESDFHLTKEAAIEDCKAKFLYNLSLDKKGILVAYIYESMTGEKLT